jgi:hypothetical protein
MGRVERGHRFCEWIHRADDWPQPPIPQPEFKRSEMGTIGFDDEEDR